MPPFRNNEPSLVVRTLEIKSYKIHSNKYIGLLFRSEMAPSTQPRIIFSKAPVLPPHLPIETSKVFLFYLYNIFQSIKPLIKLNRTEGHLKHIFSNHLSHEFLSSCRLTPGARKYCSSICRGNINTI